MIENILQMLSVPANEFRKSSGHYRNFKEFLSDTYGTVAINPKILIRRPFSIDSEFDLCLDYEARRNDKVPILTEGLREFTEVMERVKSSEYKSRDSTMQEDIMKAAAERQRLIRQFYGREAVITPITKNF